jgi:hypothetical protein
MKLPLVCAALNVAATFVCGVCGSAALTCTKAGVAVTADRAVDTSFPSPVHPETQVTRIVETK